MSKIRVVHYINNFFAGIGGEEKADIPPEKRAGVVGPGIAFQSQFNDGAEIISTVICGDTYFGENIESATQELLKMIKEESPDLFIAGPAFNAGRYGVACGTICKAVEEEARVVKDDKNKSSIRKLKKVKTKKEEFFAVNNVSFKVMEGEIVGILGPNGAGKTTLLRMLGGILTPTSGSINISGYDYSIDRNSAKKEIGYLSGNTKLYGRLSPRELLTTFASLYEMSKEDIEESIENIVKIMDMSEFIDNRIENLSTGQTQRTSIARCLIHSPKVYIFDEPTLGLDVLSSASIIDFMKNEKLRGKTVLYSTHYMEEAETLCDKIFMIHNGKIIASGTPQSLKEESGVNNLRDVFIELARKEDI